MSAKRLDQARPFPYISRDEKILKLQNQIEKLIIDVVSELTCDWDLDDVRIAADTLLCADAGFESLDIVQLVVLIEKNLNNPGIPFEQLFMQDGSYMDDVTISQLAAFIVSKTTY